MEIDDPATANPALELYDLLGQWQKMPAGQTVLQYRRSNDPDYWSTHSRANRLLDEVVQYLDERSQITGRPRAGDNYVEKLRQAINTPNQGLNYSVGQAWNAVEDSTLDWLATTGQGWTRAKLARHSEELVEISVVAHLLLDQIASVDDLDTVHKEYLLTLGEALEKAVRRSEIDGEARTARLAIELVGALNLFIPEGDADRSSLVERLKRAAKGLLIYYGPMSLAVLGANPVVQQAITSGLQ